MVGEKPCEFESFVRFLAENGLNGDQCRQLDALIHEGKAREVQEHLSSWLRACARQVVDLVEEQRANKVVQIRDPDDWFSKRTDVERFHYEGWRQHWLQLWGFVGQQNVNDERFELVVQALNLALGNSRKAKAMRKRLDAVRSRRDR